jgi:hypothetical protein
MGHQEDIAAKFNIDDSDITLEALLPIIKDMCLEESLKRLLQDEQNLEQGRIATAKELYLKPLKEKEQIAKSIYEESIVAKGEKSIEALAAKSAYDKAREDANPMRVTIEHLNTIDARLKEDARQALSYEQNTLSGNIRDACDKIKNARQGIVKVSVKAEK